MTPLRSLLALVLLIGAATISEAQVDGRIGHGGGRGPGHGPGGGWGPHRPDPYRPDPSPYDPMPGRPGPGRPMPPPPPNWGGQMGRRDVTINRQMMNERMDLGNFLFQGDFLESVDVFVGGRRWDSANIALMVNRMIEDSRSTSGGMVTLMPRRPIRIERFGDQVMLDIQGNIFVERLVLNYRQGNGGGGGGYPPGNGGDFDVSENVYRDFIGQNRIDLQSMARLYQYRGMRVLSVTVFGSSARGHGTVEVSANGFSLGQRTMNTSSTMANFQMRSSFDRIGEGLRDLTMDTRGNIFIERIVVRVARY